MIKILHSADWHLDSPLVLRKEGQSEYLKKKLSEIPEKVANLCRQEQCDMLLLSGDLFDGAVSGDTLRLVKNALEEVAVPIFIAPGNHDYADGNSPWLTTVWPDNVHIFTRQVVESVALPALNCRVYGAGFTGMDCPGLLEGFAARQEEKYAIGVLHGDPTQVSSPYCPITTGQVANSGLDYLALGHIHKGDQFFAGNTLCAWPGCPMGRGYDELGEKGVLLVTIDEKASLKFLPLDSPVFYDLDVPAVQGLGSVLPPVGNENFYRITLTGESEPVNLSQLMEQYKHFPNLELRDKTLPPVDIWSAAGEDTFEGIYFKLLREAMETADEDTKRQLSLAAQISRQLLDGQEVVLP